MNHTYSSWHIPERLNLEQLELAIKDRENDLVGHTVQHRESKEYYRITHISVLNMDRTGQYAINYCPLDMGTGKSNLRVSFTCPAKEFFGGRFLFN